MAPRRWWKMMLMCTMIVVVVDVVDYSVDELHLKRLHSICTVSGRRRRRMRWKWQQQYSARHSDCNRIPP
jgi:hypothetical protein